MDKIRVLHIGIKFWPYHISEAEKEKLIGIKGGGMVKYCDSLIHNYSNDVESYIITTLLPHQKKQEEYGNIKVLRLRCSKQRKMRLIILNIKSIFKSFKIIRDEKIELIHGHILPGILAAYIIGWLTGKTVIATPYSFYYKTLRFPFNLLAAFFEKHLYKKVDRIVFESAENYERLKRIRKTNYKNAIVVHTGIDLPPDFVKTRRADKKIKILFVGRIVKVKALDNLVLSLTEMKADDRNRIIVDIVGEAEYDEVTRLRLLVKKHSLEKVVNVHGYVAIIDDFFQEADIFILPSHSEGLSIALLEAMSYGVACIVNNFGVPFSKEEVYEMKSNTPLAIREAISYFLTNKEKIADYGKKGRKAVADSYSVKSFSVDYENIYHSLCQS